MLKKYDLYNWMGYLFFFPKHQPIQPLSDSTVGIGQDMAVAIHGGLDWGVAQLALDKFDIFPLGDEKWRVSVAQVVETDSPQTGHSKGGLKLSFNDVVRIKRIAFFICKNQIRFIDRCDYPVDFQGLF